MARETKNFGLIKAIHDGVSPPLNTKIIWFDDNVGIKIHKVYNVVTSAWEPLGSGNTVNGIYTYLAYASDDEGAEFNLAKQASSTHWALITSSTSKTPEQLTPTLFEGRWTSYGGAGGGGNFTYIGFADSEAGDNFSNVPKYEVTTGVFAYRQFMGVVTFDTPQAYTSALFSGFWAQVVQDNSSGGNYDQDIIDLWADIARVENDSTLNFEALNDDYQIFKTATTQKDIDQDSAISQLTNNLIDAIEALQSADAAALNRANHTGLQEISTITNLATTLATLIVGTGVNKIEYLTKNAFQAKVTAGTIVATTIYLTPKDIV